MTPDRKSQACDLQGDGFNLLKASHCWEDAVMIWWNLAPVSDCHQLDNKAVPW